MIRDLIHAFSQWLYVRSVIHAFRKWRCERRHGPLTLVTQDGAPMLLPCSDADALEYRYVCRHCRIYEVHRIPGEIYGVIQSRAAQKKP